MFKLLTVDSNLYRFIVRFFDMVKLNFLWLLFSIPIITIGPATIAAYTVTLKMVEDKEGHIGKAFLSAFKNNIKIGIPIGLIQMGIMYLAYLNFELFNKIENNPIVLLFATVIIVAIGLTHLTYAYPLAARYENSLVRTLQNSASISLRYALRTLALWTVILLLCVLFVFNQTLMYIGLLIGPASIFLTVSGFAVWIFKDIESNHNKQK